MADYELDIATFGKLTALIYSAVFDGSQWQSFLEELTRVTGGVHTHLFGFDIPAGISLGLTASGYAPEYIESYNQYYGEMNSWAPGFATADPGVVLPSEWMCPKAELFKSEFYNDWIRPQEDVAAGGGAILFKDDTRMIAFGGNIRLKDEEKLERPWLSTVGLLTPHLQQAFEVARVLASHSLERDLLRKGQMTAAAGLLLIAANRFVLYANDIAADMLSTGSVLRDGPDGRVSFSDSGADGELERCLRALNAGDPAVSGTFLAHANARDPMGRPERYGVRAIAFDPAQHQVSPFPLTFGYLGRSLLITIAPNMQASTKAKAFAKGFGLTAAELEIVIGIAEGKTQAQLAEARAVSIHTVRNQLKSAMSKLDVRRQAEVVRLVAGRLS
ncbi:helix-turn-helix transcriptional regulator [Pelagibacterium halotolerans]|uniref:helix-turn-helix transcriptional regulator n=1 Tax=Pelagibacterium halotolerans TaxID=531813 RepID=UPI00384B3720